MFIRASGKVRKKMKNSVEIFVKKCGNSVEKELKSVEKKDLSKVRK